MQIPDSDDLITLADAAKRTGINRETLRYHLDRHPNPPMVVIAGHIYIFRSKLNAWNKQREKSKNRRLQPRD